MLQLVRCPGGVVFQENGSSSTAVDLPAIVQQINKGLSKRISGFVTVLRDTSCEYQQKRFTDCVAAGRLVI